MEILDEALKNLQQQLDKTASGTVAPGSLASAPKAPSKQKRSKEHRQKRAEVRASLEEQRSKLSEPSDYDDNYDDDQDQEESRQEGFCQQEQDGH